MPTGFTDPVYSNKPIDAAELAALFARGLGFTIHQRDESITSPPRKREPSSYYEKKVAELEDERQHLLSLSGESLNLEYTNHVNEVNEFNKKERRKWQDMTKRYDEAIRVFRAWSPRTESGNSVKQFALKQLLESKDFDASPSGPWTMSVIGGHPQDYLEARLAENARILDRTRQSMYDEQKRCEDANRWIDDFYSDVQLLNGIRLNDETGS